MYMQNTHNSYHLKDMSVLKFKENKLIKKLPKNTNYVSNLNQIATLYLEFNLKSNSYMFLTRI